MHFSHLFTLFSTLAIVSSSTAWASPPPPVKINGSHFSPPLRGINWFGFNNRQTSVEGLWVGGTSFATDFPSIIYKLRLLKFNSVRLPFTFNDLQLQTLPKQNPCKVLTIQEIIAKTQSTLSPPLKPPIGLPDPKTSVCNTAIPHPSLTHQRFLWTIDYFVKAGFYVIIDYHPMGEEQYANDPKVFVQKWRDLWLSITRMPDFTKNLKGRVLIDIMNEPDSMGKNWEQAGELYIKTMDALYNIHNPVFLIEGTGQTGYGLNWGNGFVTKPSIIKEYKISDPRPFFNELLRKPYLKQVVISPHLYGPSISKDLQRSTSELYQRWYDSFGYLGLSGYKGYKFPIVIGEFGSFFTDQRDVSYYTYLSQWLNKYFKKEDIHWLFWTYSENSGDTGGIVMNNGQDIHWGKIKWLQKFMHL